MGFSLIAKENDREKERERDRDRLRKRKTDRERDRKREREYAKLIVNFSHESDFTFLRTPF